MKPKKFVNRFKNYFPRVLEIEQELPEIDHIPTPMTEEIRHNGQTFNILT